MVMSILFLFQILTKLATGVRLCFSRYNLMEFVQLPPSLPPARVEGGL